ncbi:MAG: type II toxin-antitoxin system VapC family toxin [Chloroflexi bacterium]|nr:type II toxin-antitoxin system VapC family toxin [Chloroflexota bacterium]
MSALVLDAGAFIAVERGDRAMMARLEAAEADGIELRTSAIVVAQVWRDPAGRQARLARLLRAVDVRAVDERLARAAGALLGQAGAADPIDATVVLVAASGDHILTSDPEDLRRLAETADVRVAVVPC